MPVEFHVIKRILSHFICPRWHWHVDGKSLESVGIFFRYGHCALCGEETSRVQSPKEAMAGVRKDHGKG